MQSAALTLAPDAKWSVLAHMRLARRPMGLNCSAILKMDDVSTEVGMNGEQVAVCGASDEQATYHAIGRFIFEFSQLEYSIRHFTGERAGVKDECFNAVMTHDFAILCTVAIDVISKSMDGNDSKTFKKIIQECRKLNDVRVKVAHGLWVPFESGGTVHHVSRSTLKNTMSARQASELEKHAARANELRAVLHSLL